MSVFICVNQFNLLTTILNYLQAIRYCYTMCIDSNRIVYHTRELTFIIQDQFLYPMYGMNRSEYITYERKTDQSYVNSMYMAYKSFLGEVSQLNDKDAFYQMLYVNKMEIKDYVMASSFLSNSVIRTVMSNIISDIYMITESTEESILSVNEWNYMKYTIFNINNALSVELLNLLDHLLGSILKICNITENTKILSYYISMISGVFILLVLLLLFAILLWIEKNNVLKLLLYVNPKTYMYFTEICDQMVEKIKTEQEIESNEDSLLNEAHHESVRATGHFSKRTYQNINPYLKKVIAIISASFFIFETFIVSCLIIEYQGMQSLSTFSVTFKSTTLAGLTFYSLLNSFRARIVNSVDVQLYHGIPLVNYTDSYIFAALEETTDSYIVIV